jgi:hypothetical protein
MMSFLIMSPLWLATALALASCDRHESKGRFVFCPDTPIFGRMSSETITFDLFQETVQFSDVVRPMSVIRSRDAVGIIEPYRIALPAGRAFPPDIRSFAMGGVEFAVLSLEDRNSWRISSAEEHGRYPDGMEVATRTVVDFSGSRGIEAIRLELRLPKGEERIERYVPCSDNGTELMEFAQRDGGQTGIFR